MVASQHRCYFNGIMMGTQRNDDAIRLSVFFVIFIYDCGTQTHTDSFLSYDSPSVFVTMRDIQCNHTTYRIPHKTHKD